MDPRKKTGTDSRRSLSADNISGLDQDFDPRATKHSPDLITLAPIVDPQPQPPLLSDAEREDASHTDRRDAANNLAPTKEIHSGPAFNPDAEPELIRVVNPPEMNNSVKSVSLALAIGAFACEGGYEYFTYVYVRQMLLDLSAKLGEDGIVQINPGVATTIAAVITALDACSNLTMFNPWEEAESMGRMFKDGFLKGVYQYAKSCVTPKGFLTVGIPTLGMAISFPVGSYADAEALDGWLQSHLGAFKYIPIGISMVFGSTYYVMAFGKATLDGVKFLFNLKDEAENGRDLEKGEPEDNSPRQRYLIEHLYNGKRAEAIQVLIESLSAQIVRAGSFAFLAKQLLEHANVTNPLALTVGSLIAAGATFVQAFPQRHGRSYKPFLGDANNRIDLVTDAEIKEAYDILYKQMSYAEFLGREALRVLKVSGPAQAFTVGYLAKQAADLLPAILPNIKVYGISINQAISIATAIASGIGTYAIYRRAEINVECGNFITQRQRADQGILPKHDELQIGTAASGFGTLFSAGTNTARTLSNMKFLSDMILFAAPGLAPTTVLAIATGLSLVVAVNGFRVFKAGNEECLQKYFNKLSTCGSSLWSTSKNNNDDAQPLLSMEEGRPYSPSAV